MKHTTFLFLLFSSLLSAAAQACTAAAVPVSPATVSRSPMAGTGQMVYAVIVSLNCNAGETYSIASTSPNFNASIGSSGFSAQGTFYRDPTLSQPLFTSPATGTAASFGTVETTIYGVIQGSATGGLFNGVGTYSVPLILTITSSGGAPVSLVYIEGGQVQGTCYTNNVIADFGSILSGVAHPIKPVALSLNCTSGLPYSISQPSVALVTIGSITTNTAWVYSDAGGTSPLNTTPITGTGSGTAQAINLYVGLSGATISSPIVGVGQISGSLNVVVSY